MKRITALLALTLILAACGGTSAPPTVDPPVTGTLSVNGTIQGWSAEYGRGIQAFTLDDEPVGQGTVDASGNFGIQLTSPQPSRTRPGGCSDAMPASVTSSPSSLRVANISFSSTLSRIIFISLIDSPSPSRSATYLYASEAGSITGQESCAAGLDESYTITYTYEMQLQQGWNILLSTLTRNAEGGITAISYRSESPTADLSGYSWFVNDLRF